MPSVSGSPTILFEHILDGPCGVIGTSSAVRLFIQWDFAVGLFNRTFNASGVFELKDKYDFFSLEASINDASLTSAYKIKSEQRAGMATIQLVDWSGDELLYSFGEAQMENATSVVRW